MDVHGTPVRSCAELAAGDEIEAWHNGKLFHRGRVTQAIPLMELFWILDARTGSRKLLDLEALEIRRCPSGALPGKHTATGTTADLPQSA